LGRSATTRHCAARIAHHWRCGPWGKICRACVRPVRVHQAERAISRALAPVHEPVHAKPSSAAFHEHTYGPILSALGVSVVTQSVAERRNGVVASDAAGQSCTTTARPAASCPVTMRRPSGGGAGQSLDIALSMRAREHTVGSSCLHETEQGPDLDQMPGPGRGASSRPLTSKP
jgi:hypothetical protein